MKSLYSILIIPVIVITLGQVSVAQVTIVGGDYAGGNLIPNDGDKLNGVFTNVETFHIKSGVTVYVTPETALSINANTIIIEGVLNGVGAGYPGGKSTMLDSDSGKPGQGPGGGAGGPFGPCVHGGGGAGGGYGGKGGNGGRPFESTSYALGGAVYGSPNLNGVQMGSGGGSGANYCSNSTGSVYGGNGGAGGASISLQSNGVTLISGSVLANGSGGFLGYGTDGYGTDGWASTTQFASGGGGSGGGIEIITNEGYINGNLSAAGGQGAGNSTIPFSQGGGGGGGGRIKILGKVDLTNATVSIKGGNPGLSSTGFDGSILPQAGNNGTIYMDITPPSPKIMVSATTNSTFCAGAILNVTYTALGTFNSGNIFTAQLSDALGSFATPVNIGTISSSASGAISSSIPSNTPAGTGYRIRVIGSDPAVIGNNNGSDITINPLPTATLSGGGSICLGSSANLSVALTGSGPWSVTYTDGTTPVTVSNITASPHTIAVSPASTVTYSLVSASDANCNATSLSGTAQVAVNSVPVVTVPTIASVGNDAGSCGALVTFAATATGAPTPTISYTINGSPITSPHTFPVGTTTVTATATNSCGSDSETFNVTVTNDAPVLGVITPSTLDPVQINSSFSASATFTDNNLQSATWNWGDGTTSAGMISGSTISGSRTYAATGVYTIGLSAKDACNSEASNSYQYVVVYDPSGGFVTGGGWINSPAGAYKADVTLVGRANFGFVSKYQKGAKVPSGDTNFEFQTANLHFKSTSYEWLVVSGATARYKGVGTINGSGNYGFILSAIDGQVTGGGGVDRFRIKIWDRNNNDAIVYDNNLSATGDDALAETAIMGGSIVVHEAKKTSTSSTSKLTAAGTVASEPRAATFYSYPTAFSEKTMIAFSLDQNESYELEVFDMRGALVKKLARGNAEANKLYEFELRGDGMAEGMYIMRLTTNSRVQSLKSVLKR